MLSEANAVYSPEGEFACINTKRKESIIYAFQSERSIFPEGGVRLHKIPKGRKALLMLSRANAVYSTAEQVQAVNGRRARKNRSVFNAQLLNFEDSTNNEPLEINVRPMKALNWHSPAEVFKRFCSGD